MLEASGAGTGNGCRICPSAALLPACRAGAGVQLKDKDRNPSIAQNSLSAVPW